MVKTFSWEDLNNRFLDVDFRLLLILLDSFMSMTMSNFGASLVTPGISEPHRAICASLAVRNMGCTA